MHELSLAQGLLDQLDLLARSHGADRIVLVDVGIGREAGIVTDSFIFGFNAVKKTTQLTKDTILKVTPSEGRDLILNRVEMKCGASPKPNQHPTAQGDN